VDAGNITKADVTYFLDCVENGHPSELSAIEAAQTTEILSAAYQSAASGKVIRLDG